MRGGFSDCGARMPDNCKVQNQVDQIFDNDRYQLTQADKQTIF
jgi:hypothetical protein